MINNGSARGIENAGRRTFIAFACATAAATSIGLQMSGNAAPTVNKSAAKTEKKPEAKVEKKPEAKPEPVIENVQSATTEQLVDKPHDYLNKNVKFTANFSSFTSLALDYKPAMRSSKNYLSFLVLRPNSKIPFSELKLAMAIPKEKDPDNALLAGLKDGDEIEITGHVFAAALDEPWVDVLKVKKLSSAPEKEDAEKKASAADGKDKPKSGTDGNNGK